MSTEPEAPRDGVELLALEIAAAVLADESDGGCDLSAGLFGPAMSAIIRRLASRPQPAAGEVALPTLERDALLAVIRACEANKKPCGEDPESPTAVRNVAFASIASIAAQGLGWMGGPSLSVPVESLGRDADDLLETERLYERAELMERRLIDTMRTLWVVLRMTSGDAGIVIPRKTLEKIDWSECKQTREDDLETGGVKICAIGPDVVTAPPAPVVPDDYAMLLSELSAPAEIAQCNAPKDGRTCYPECGCDSPSNCDYPPSSTPSPTTKKDDDNG